MPHLWSFVVLAGLVSATSVASTFPVPPGASEVNSLESRDGSQKQDSYLLSVAFPDTSAISHYRNVLKEWRECPSRAASWEVFGDLSVEPNQLIHQLLWSWINADNREIVVVALQYRSRGVAYSALPATNQQRVNLGLFRSRDAAADAQTLGYICK